MTNDDGQATTALDKTAKHGKDHTIQIWLANVAQVEVKDFWDMTPPHRAAEKTLYPSYKTAKVTLDC